MKPMIETAETLYHTEKKRVIGIIFTGIVILLCSIFYGLNAGSIHFSIQEVIAAFIGDPTVPVQTSMVIMDIRLPRILLAVLTGASLAVAGTVMQALMRNPLVSPFTLGLSSAASFGAACAIVIGSMPLLLLPLKEYQDGIIVIFAFIAGVGSIFLIYAISKLRGSTSATLILAGVVLGYIFQAGLLLLQYTSNNDKLREITLWLMGGMWGANWSAVLITLPVVIVSLIYLQSKAWDLNALLAGDEIARNVGVDIEKVRMRGLLFSALATSACLAFTGIIGFIGLIGPHVGRMLIGNDSRYLIPFSALLGAIILLISDTVARTIIEPVEIPVGVIMYLIGGFFFMYLIMSSKHRIIT